MKNNQKNQDLNNDIKRNPNDQKNAGQTSQGAPQANKNFDKNQKK